MVRALPYVVPVALALFALIDLSRSTAVERAEIHPFAWVAIIVLLPVIGPVAWIAVSRQRAAAARRAGGATTARPQQRPGPARPRRTGPVAPDDDPDFLWRLEQEQRRRAREAGGQAPPAAGGQARRADGSADADGAPGDGPADDGPGDRRADGPSAG